MTYIGSYRSTIGDEYAVMSRLANRPIKLAPI